mgnify:CR=1 FL=1
MDESASEWVFEYVHGVFQAPTWEGPIGTFIDDNCIVFDDEEENKLSHTEVHQVRRHNWLRRATRLQQRQAHLVVRQSHVSSSNTYTFRYTRGLFAEVLQSC